MKTNASSGDELVAALGVFVMAAAAVVGVVFMLVTLEAFTLYVLWGWFVVPFGAQPLTIPWAAGIMLVVAMAKSVSVRKDPSAGTWDFLVNALFKCGVLLAVGYVVKHYFM